MGKWNSDKAEGWPAMERREDRVKIIKQ